MERMRAGRGRGALGALALVVALVGAVGPARAQIPAESETPPRIRSIVFTGAEQVSPGKLRHAMRLHAKAWWRPFQRNYFYGTDQLEPDLERVLAVYRGEGLNMARIEEATVRYLSREWVDLEIRVREGRRAYVHSVAISGAPEGVRVKALGDFATRPREPLRETTLQADERRLQVLCEEEGYALAEVTRETRFVADSVDVILWVDRGPLVRVGEIEVAGLTRTRPQVVLRELRLERGDLFRRSRAATSQERLLDLGLFRTVRIVPTFSDSTVARREAPELSVALKVNLAEKPAGWYGLGFGYSSADQVRLLGEWGYRNLMGRARALQANGLIAYSLQRVAGSRRRGPKEEQLELIYTEPWIFSPLWGQVRTYARHNREATFEEDLYGLVLGARRDLTRTDRLLASIENKWVSTTDTTAARGWYQTRFVSLSYASDRRDFALDPHRGSFAQLRAEYAGGFLGGAASFARGVVNASAYVPLATRLTWAYRVRAGVTRPIGRGVAGEGEERELLRVPFDERFRAGGGTTVRGYGEGTLGPYTADGQVLGGLMLTVVNFELRFPIYWQFTGAVFLDAGNVWEDYRHMTAGRWVKGLTGHTYSELDVAYGTGVGLRWMTPVGPLRLDYGWKLGHERRAGTAPGEWHFSLGQAF
jgi:outer membrane protein insertion porin family